MDDDEYDYPPQDGDACGPVPGSLGLVRHYCSKYPDGTVTSAFTGEILSA